ncbi:MAG: hypothetical protein DSZ29_06455 [Aquificaceae bacterium]|nr:MAG: hypothetical protein DSZ29_06455 [Aquificaceae bacterium]
MYQFPDSTNNETEIFHNSEPTTANKKKYFKAILVANILLALFVASIVWFLFFFDSTAHNAPVSELSISSQNTQIALGSFTPVIIESNQEATPSNTEKKSDAQTPSKIITPEESSAIDAITKELEKNQLSTSPEAISITSHKQQVAKSEPSLPVEKVSATKKQAEKISAIDAITKELEKNQLSASPEVINITSHKQQAVKSEISTPSEKVSSTKIQAKKMSAIDAITKELEKNQQKDKTTAPKLHLSHGRSLQTAQSSDKKTLIELNQIVVEKNTIPKLEKILLKASKHLSTSEHTLFKQLKTAISPTSTDKNKKEKADSSDILNSVSLKKSKDIDKIMAAMGSIETPPLTKSIEKIENKVKYLLTTEKNKYRTTNQYEKALEPEAKVNNNEMRILTVKNGETIWDIAVRAYGDGNQYKKILNANPLIKKNPTLLKTGVTLRVPLETVSK